VAAVPSIDRASRVVGSAPPEADVTRELYEQYANQIFRYCLHQLGSREEAEDAVQSTFLNAFRGIKRGVVPELESAWLFKIAHNVCLSRRRSSWRRGRIESPADFELVQELTPAPSRRADELIGLQDVLGQMPEAQRRAILLREWQGLSYREIADELDVSQAAVETLIFRARRALAAGLEQPPVAKRRIARAFDLGNLITAVKSLLIGGSAAAKVAATVAAVSATTVVAAEPVVHHRLQHRPTPARSVPHAKAAVVPAVPTTVAAAVTSTPHTIAPAPKRQSAPRHPARARTSLAGAAPVHDTAAPATPAAQPAVVEQQPAAPVVEQQQEEQPAPPAQAVPPKTDEKAGNDENKRSGDGSKGKHDSKGKSSGGDNQNGGEGDQGDVRRPSGTPAAPAPGIVISVPQPATGDTTDSAQTSLQTTLGGSDGKHGENKDRGDSGD
jgi:RNA polymerase sigma factor (sigma-70 family)